MTVLRKNSAVVKSLIAVSFRSSILPTVRSIEWIASEDALVSKDAKKENVCPKN